MGTPLNLLEESTSHITLEEKAVRADAKTELFNFKELATEAPDWLPPSAKSEWNRLMPVLRRDFPISETDYGLLINYCLAFSRIKTSEDNIRKYGTFIKDDTSGTRKTNPAVNTQSKAMADMKSAANALGMTLEARSKLAMNKAKAKVEDDPFKELMET